ncbi:MAG TPA: metallophosphoesterase [Solirubrobacterales bacterium]|nr:metallophosphoesterase [Solirubrobacterales bacterium]
MAPRAHVNFAVISDPHALGGDEHRHETAAWKQTSEDPTRNPFAAVRKLIDESKRADEPLTADAVLCPGDLAHRMSEAGLEYAWEELESIARLLGATQIIATAGNHDVIRKEDLPADAEAGAWVAPLRSLKPPFPTHFTEDCDAYFNDDFIIATDKRWRVVTLNSCAFHTEKDEHRHGKVDPGTVEHLRRRIADDRKDVNVLMCHHHPVEWTHLSQQDTSHMRGGDHLLRALEEVDPTGWLVLHGHRHTAALGYAGDSSSGPTRMSAGSLGISLPQEGRTDRRNQFYMLEFDLVEIAQLRLAGAGRFRAWDWNREAGMTPSSPTAALPGVGGFGFRRDAHTLARMCREHAESLGRRSVTMEELTRGDRRWAYVAPRDLLMLRTVLERESSQVDPDDGGSHIERVSFGV